MAKKKRDEVLSMSPLASPRTPPPPAVDRAARAAFKTGAIQPSTSNVQRLNTGNAPGRRKRGLVLRADGTALRHVAAYLPPALFQRLRDHADDHGQTVSEVMVDAVRRLLDAQDAS